MSENLYKPSLAEVQLDDTVLTPSTSQDPGQGILQLKPNHMIEQTLEKMRKKKLYGMIRSYKLVIHTHSMAGLTADGIIHLLLENVWNERQEQSME